MRLVIDWEMVFRFHSVRCDNVLKLLHNNCAPVLFIPEDLLMVAYSTLALRYVKSHRVGSAGLAVSVCHLSHSVN